MISSFRAWMRSWLPVAAGVGSSLTSSSSWAGRRHSIGLARGRRVGRVGDVLRVPADGPDGRRRPGAAAAASRPRRRRVPPLPRGGRERRRRRRRATGRRSGCRRSRASPAPDAGLSRGLDGGDPCRSTRRPPRPRPWRRRPPRRRHADRTPRPLGPRRPRRRGSSGPGARCRRRGPRRTSGGEQRPQRQVEGDQQPGEREPHQDRRTRPAVVSSGSSVPARNRPMRPPVKSPLNWTTWISPRKPT